MSSSLESESYICFHQWKPTEKQPHPSGQAGNITIGTAHGDSGKHRKRSTEAANTRLDDRHEVVNARAAMYLPECTVTYTSVKIVNNNGTSVCPEFIGLLQGMSDNNLHDG
ncbi:hypothetical protein F441_16035 [Phytophthora nicotianae CJ01A1]|uniref:Uncharacterized protein n=2 Tax=Phytophthora nicotianae TaxID=4792 RepID=W2WE24_PHYNI|nr:hypothetical protein L915_15768 [Phytophthora nicotianae]ETP07834.1 hypothetical protein F441_16035 [Phytophthora nicotianae CJ01A1]